MCAQHLQQIQAFICRAMRVFLFLSTPPDPMRVARATVIFAAQDCALNAQPVLPALLTVALGPALLYSEKVLNEALGLRE